MHSVVFGWDAMGTQGHLYLLLAYGHGVGIENGIGRGDGRYLLG